MVQVFLLLLTAYSSAALGQLFFFHVVLIRKVVFFPVFETINNHILILLCFDIYDKYACYQISLPKCIEKSTCLNNQFANVLCHQFLAMSFLLECSLQLNPAVSVINEGNEDL